MSVTVVIHEIPGQHDLQSLFAATVMWQDNWNSREGFFCMIKKF